MNKNINLTKILKNCPIGWEFYSSIYGKVAFYRIENDCYYPIVFCYHDKEKGERCGCVSKQGLYETNYYGECIFFPSKDQRDWTKFSAPWYKKEKFDPKTLQPFDKVLARRGNENYNVWFPDFISDPPNSTNNKTLCMCVMEDIAMVIPYNDETKHLIGTTEEAPEFYRYWED